MRKLFYQVGLILIVSGLPFCGEIFAQSSNREEIAVFPLAEELLITQHGYRNRYLLSVEEDAAANLAAFSVAQPGSFSSVREDARQNESTSILLVSAPIPLPKLAPVVELPVAANGCWSEKRVILSSVALRFDRMAVWTRFSPCRPRSRRKRRRRRKRNRRSCPLISARIVRRNSEPKRRKSGEPLPRPGRRRIFSLICRPRCWRS
ncbi:MAG: hypothetical protein LBI18_14705 [Planctomycetaceae bacterium]|nr:hypothetical protein [Planctomycetaceae bacterium]